MKSCRWFCIPVICNVASADDELDSGAEPLQQPLGPVTCFAQTHTLLRWLLSERCSSSAAFWKSPSGTSIRYMRPYSMMKVCAAWSLQPALRQVSIPAANAGCRQYCHRDYWHSVYTIVASLARQLGTVSGGLAFNACCKNVSIHVALTALITDVHFFADAPCMFLPQSHQPEFDRLKTSLHA